LLKQTFCHLPGVDAATERALWSRGIRCWEDARQMRGHHASLAHRLTPSFERLAGNDPRYFAEALPAQQHWRLFPEFRRAIAYLDIETTGLRGDSAITTIALYDGHVVRCYVQGENLHQFVSDVQEYEVVVSYNGKAFDVPFIERSFGVKLHHAHIDLMYVLRSLGYRGGLKGCEKSLGLDRKELADVDGYFAVLLWQEYRKTRNPQALETLLAYNVQDVVNLETLMVMAYNLKLKETPFGATLRLDLPAAPPLPYAADTEIIRRLKRQNPHRYF
jgi:uncharacterized protein